MEYLLKNKSQFVLALSKINGWGNKKVADYVVKHDYDLEECFNFLEVELENSELELFNKNLEIAAQELEKNEEKHIKSICLFDDGFPKKLCECRDPVIYLYYAGDVSLLESQCLTIIGTRNPNEPFIQKGEMAACYFAKNGYTIVSGLALGCDSIAHRASLAEHGKTIAILPSSLDKVLPTQNKELASEIVRSGGLVISEYGVGSPMNKFNYAQRDRIQSLLSNVIVVIQSEEDGGTMIAVKRSVKDGKTVYAIEGNHLSVINNYFEPSNVEQLKEIESYIK